MTRTSSPGARRATRSAPPSRHLAGGADAAAYADVSTRTIRRYIAHGRLTGYRVGPRLVKIDLDELDERARPIPTARGPGPGSDSRWAHTGTKKLSPGVAGAELHKRWWAVL